MKVTIKKNEPEVKPVYIGDVKTGYVFEFLNPNNLKKKGPSVLKLWSGKSVILTFANGDNWLDLHDGSMEYRPVKVLGKLTEIIVEE